MLACRSITEWTYKPSVELTGFTRHCLRNGFDAGADGREVILWEIEPSWSRGVRRDPPAPQALAPRRSGS